MTDDPMAEPLRTRPPHRGTGSQRVRRSRSYAFALLLVTGGAVLGWALPRLERHLPSLGLSFSASTAQATLAAIAGSMITLAGFVVTAITLVVQTVQSMSPRLVAALGNVSHYLVLFGQLVGTALYALVTLSQLHGDTVPRGSVTLGIVFVLVDAVAVLHLLSSLRHAVTGGGLSRAVGKRLRTVIDQIYPAAPPFSGAPPEVDGPDTGGRPYRAALPLVRTGPPAVIYNLDEPRLTRLTARHDLRFQLVRAVGDFVGTGTVVAQLQAPGGGIVPPRLSRKVAACVHYGPSRTIEQDSSFGFRLLADIAIRALSPAVNDPTTAVQALDQIEDALARLAPRPLGPAWIVDAAGHPRVAHPAPDWPGLVSLALDETLMYGASNPQVVRRLRALLSRLLAVAPEDRGRPLADRLAALGRLSAAALPDPLLHEIAEHPDHQGLGGLSG